MLMLWKSKAELIKEIESLEKEVKKYQTLLRARTIDLSYQGQMSEDIKKNYLALEYDYKRIERELANKTTTVIIKFDNDTTGKGVEK